MSAHEPPPPGPSAVDRRTFLRGAGAATAVALGLGALGAPDEASAAPAPRGVRRRLARRRAAAFNYRLEAAKRARVRNTPLAVPRANGEEEDYPGYVANYSKALPHDTLGHVAPVAYEALLAALRSGDPADFESIPLAGSRRLTSPQAGLTFDLEGPDAQALTIRPAPRLDGPEAAAEMAELYWMALARDVDFATYANDPVAAAAAADLSRLSDFRGPQAGGQVTAATLFRGFTPDDLVGPYVSQFLLYDIPYGSLTVSQRQRTVEPGIDYLTDFPSWLAVQNGAAAGPDRLAPEPRHIRTLRDLAQYVHVDALYQAYLNACLVLLGMRAPLDPGLPPVASHTQDGFAVFGGPHVLSLVTEVATRALKAVWFQKWFVHRRLRPEELGGRVHNQVTGTASYPLHAELLGSAALAAVFGAHGSYLLPQAYPDGCPTHPAYGAGHATVAGACVTVLKAFFDESFVLPDPVVPSADGTDLVAWAGPPLTVAGELNKLAANIALGRSAAGIHYRTDYSESLLLGEAVALGILEEQKPSYNEDMSFTLTRFDGTTVTL